MGRRRHGHTDVASSRAPREFDPEEGLPPGVALVTAGADVQQDRIEVELRGSGTQRGSWVFRVRLPPWQHRGTRGLGCADQVLSLSFQHPYGPELMVAAACIDTGFRQPIVQTFCYERSHRHVFPVKGAAGQRPVWARMPSKSGDKRPLWIIGSDAAKEAVTARLRIATPGPGFCHFPITDQYDRAYFEQLNSEVCKVKYNRGYAHREWHKKPDTRNEALDCRCYAYAALQAAVMAGLRLNRQADQIEAMGGHR